MSAGYFRDDLGQFCDEIRSEKFQYSVDIAR